MMEERIIILLVLSAVCINCLVLKGKAYYCRDPDTGKLHEVDSTWAASSFCGNYTCNLRRRNVTLTSVSPIREFNVTNISEQTDKDTEPVTVTIEKRTESALQPILHKLMKPDARNINYNEDNPQNKINNIQQNYYNEQKQYRPVAHNCKKQKDNLSEQNDRYLSEQEIDSIADLLHTVKRSDLDAIVDIYNLAQDIYKEIDEAANEEIKDEAFNFLKEEVHKTRNIKPHSYWYDPLASKGRIGDRYDLDLQNTFGLISTEKPKVAPKFFNGRLLNSDIGKTPYYYPVTQFQRLSSYTNPTYSYKATTQNSDMIGKPEIIREEIPTLHDKNVVENNQADPRKLIQPSHYLPYPFTNIHPYNLSESRNIYYGSPWMLDYHNRYKYYQPYYNPYIGHVQKALLINPHLNNEVQDLEQHTIKQPVEIQENEQVNERRENVPISNNNNKENREVAVDSNRDTVDTLLKGQMTSNWKTDPLPIEVLKDIKADIDTSRLLKAFPLRKKIKLERVGKLISLDDLNSQVNRNKRFAATQIETHNVTEHGEFETYLERVTCRVQTKPGYFRIGNLSQPYPECCPKLIDTR